MEGLLSFAEWGKPTYHGKHHYYLFYRGAVREDTRRVLSFGQTREQINFQKSCHHGIRQLYLRATSSGLANLPLSISVQANPPNPLFVAIISDIKMSNHLGGGLVVITWDQEVCFLCDFRFEPCGYSYDGHWRLTWSLTSGPVRLVEVRASWPGHPR